MKYKLNLKTCYELLTRLYNMAYECNGAYGAGVFQTETKTYLYDEIPEKDRTKVEYPEYDINKFVELCSLIVDATERVSRAAELTKAELYKNQSYESLVATNRVLQMLSKNLMFLDKESDSEHVTPSAYVMKTGDEYKSIPVDMKVQRGFDCPSIKPAALSMSKLARSNSTEIETFLATPVEVDMGNNPLDLFDILAMTSDTAVATYLK